MKRIFLQIAAYRDTELVPTVQDALAQATHPERISFGICWQYMDVELHYIDLLKPFVNCRIDAIPARYSQGLGWARNKAQQLWQGEEYTLQTDAHMRFVQGWDELLIEMLGQCPSEKAILSAFPPGYKPPRTLVTHGACRSRGTHFSDNGYLNVQAYDDLSSCDAPQLGAFIAGGFLFAPSIAFQEVPPDPYIYFTDEIPYGARLWTQGWDIYHPHRVVCWHYYNIGSSRIFNWNDRKDWHKRHKNTFARIRQLLGMEERTQDFGIYDLGTVRSLVEYEALAGVNFKQRTVQTVQSGQSTSSKQTLAIASPLAKESIPTLPETPETQLLKLCARTPISPEIAPQIHQLAQTPLRFGYLREMATQQGVSALLYGAINQVCPQGIPAYDLYKLREEFQKQAVGNLYKSKELLRILDLFNEHKIRALPYKGPILALSAYGNLALRSFCDLDIIIDPAQAIDAKNLLCQHGYHLLNSPSNHAWDFILSNRKVTIDLHQKITPKFYAFSLSFEELWQRSIPLLWEGKKIPLLSPEDLLLTLSLHGLKDRWKRLIWLCDLQQIIQTTPTLNWESLLQRAQNYGVERILLVSLRLVEHSLGLSLPEIVQQRIAADVSGEWCYQYLKAQLFEQLPLTSELKTIFDSFRLDLQIRERWIDRLQYIWWRIISPNWRDRNTLKLPSFLSFGYIFIRPFRLIARFTRPLIWKTR